MQVGLIGVAINEVKSKKCIIVISSSYRPALGDEFNVKVGVPWLV